MTSRLSGILCLVFILFSLPSSANAQSAASASISPPQVKAFPFIETYLDIHDAESERADLQGWIATLVEQLEDIKGGR